MATAACTAPVVPPPQAKDPSKQVAKELQCLTPHQPFLKLERAARPELPPVPQPLPEHELRPHIFRVRLQPPRKGPPELPLRELPKLVVQGVGPVQERQPLDGQLPLLLRQPQRQLVPLPKDGRPPQEPILVHVDH